MSNEALDADVLAVARFSGNVPCVRFSIVQSLFRYFIIVEVLTDKENIVVIVCGGAGVTFAQIDAWKQKLDNE